MLTTSDMRKFLNDKKELNVLLDAVQFSDDDIDSAIDFVVADFNETPPFTALSRESFPFINTLKLGTAAQLLYSAANLDVRNQLQYSAGGLTVNDDGKGPDFQALAARYDEMYEIKKRAQKNAVNLDNGWGSSSYVGV